MALMRENYFLEIIALQAFKMTVLAPDIEEAEGKP
jgi:hypothetical protein